MARFGVLPAALAAVVLAAVPAGAETYRFVAPDGTVHLTNAPTDPRYQRLGFTSGTAQEWLRLPGPDLAPYAREILEAAERYGVPERLISAVIRTESAFNPLAVSRKGARGLMQLMPGTASLLGVRDAFDPRENIDGGVRHLRALIERFGDNLSLVLAAYNAGEQAVVNHGGVPPYPETRNYVTRVLGLFGASSPAPLLKDLKDSQEPKEAQDLYRTVEPDGVVIYTNIPPRGQL